MLQAGIERNFEIIGEALGRMRKTDLATAQKVPIATPSSPFAICLFTGTTLSTTLAFCQIIRDDVPELNEAVSSLLSVNNTQSG